MANPSADFPTGIHSATDISAYGNSALGKTALKHTEVEGKQEQEIVAIQTELGVNTKTITEATAPTATPTSVAEYLDMVATQLKAIIGGTHWYTSITSSLASLTSHLADLANPHAVTKTQVGLGNVDNIQQEPANANIQGHIVATGNPHGMVANDLGLGTDDSPQFAGLSLTGNPDLNGIGPHPVVSEYMDRIQETIITNFQSGHGFTLTSGGGAILDDTSVYCRGTQSLKLTTKGDGTQLRVTSGALSPTLDLSGKIIKVLLKSDDPTNFLTTSGQVFIGFSSDNFSSHYFYYSATYTVAHEYGGNTWIEIEFSPSNQNTTGAPDLTAINAIRLYVKDNPVGIFNIWFQSISYYPIAAPEGIVSIVFDDGHGSQYTQAMKKLSQYGFPATAYIMPDQIGTGAYLTLAQCKEMQEANRWDISGHHSTNLTTMSASECESALKSVKNYLIKNGFTKGADHFAYPQGDYNQTVIPIIKKYFLSGRLSSSQSHSLLPTNTPYRLKAYSTSNQVPSATIAAEVTKCITNKDWLILVYHRIVETPSIAEDHSIAEFETEIDNIYSSGVKVMTVSEVFNRFYPQNDHTKLSNIGTNTHAQIDTFIANTVKASGSEIATGTDDEKFATSLAIKTAGIEMGGGAIPANYNALAWTYDPAIGTSSYALVTKGTAYGARIYIPKAMTISNIIYCTSGSSATSLANAFMALYQDGSLLFQTASQITNWQASSGTKTVAITPQAVVAGFIDIIFWASDWATAPTFIRASGSSLVNFGLSTTAIRFFTADTGLTDTAPGTLGAKTALNISFWLAVS